MMNSFNKMETELELLGATGIEDRQVAMWLFFHTVKNDLCEILKASAPEVLRLFVLSSVKKRSSFSIVPLSLDIK